MADQEMRVKIIYNNAGTCEHDLAVSQERLNELMGEAVQALNSSRGGAFTLFSPFGVHRLSEIAAIHFDAPTAPPPQVEQLGFQTPSP